ncbi:MAG: alpha/beta hydrolase [Pseudomonadota bacterium]
MRPFLIFALVLTVFAVPACSSPDEAPTDMAAASPFESQHFTVTVAGAGPDVILMPGLASDAAVWDATAAALSDRHTVHVVQVSGFSGAPARGNAGNETVLDDLARDLSAYAKTLDGAPTLVGHSLGGLVAMKTALQPDAALSQLVIVDVLPFFSVLMDPAATSDSMVPVAAMMKAALLGQSDDVFALRQAEALSALVKGEADLQKALDWSVASDRAVMAQAMSEVLVTDLRSQISAIEIPTTVIYARDGQIPNMNGVEAFYQDLYAVIPDLMLIAIDDALHFVMLDQPEAFQAAVDAALMR